MSKITLYHNPDCGTSRNTLAMIRNSGTEPTIIYYLETPPSREELAGLLADMAISARDLLRKNVEPYEKLGLEEEKFSDEQLIDFMVQYPLLINRPIVVTERGRDFAALRNACWIFCLKCSRARSAKRTASR